MKNLDPVFSAKHRIIASLEGNTNSLEWTVRYCDPDTSERPNIALRRTGNMLRLRFPKSRVRFIPVREDEILRLISESDKPIRRNPQKIANHIGDLPIQSMIPNNIASIVTDAPIITLLNSILLEAKNAHASDVHIEIDRRNTSIRFRIDGQLSFVRSLTKENGVAIVRRIKLISNLNTLETRKPQDGRFTIESNGVEYSVRVSAIPASSGESVALRFLNAGDHCPVLDELGFTPDIYKKLKEITKLPHGLVLVTGSTGSGKTTTLAALLSEVGPLKKKIISVEDPVEYIVSGTVQIQTNEALGLGFGTLLRRILRQDPDVVMIGEIRDSETAIIAVRAALTGHLVFATLHTGKSGNSERRMSDLGVSPENLHAVLQAVISQKLVSMPNDGRKPQVKITCYYDKGSFDDK